MSKIFMVKESTLFDIKQFVIFLCYLKYYSVLKIHIVFLSWKIFFTENSIH